MDGLAGSRARFRKLKELRLEGTIRIAFAYHAGSIVLLPACGDKRGVSSAKFYELLIESAIEQYDVWIEERMNHDG